MYNYSVVGFLVRDRAFDQAVGVVADGGRDVINDRAEVLWGVLVADDELHLTAEAHSRALNIGRGV